MGILPQTELEKPMLPKEVAAVVVTNSPKLFIPPKDMKMPI